MTKITRRQVLGATTALGVGALASSTSAQSNTDSNGGISDLYANADAFDLAELVKRKEVTPGELLEEAIRRLESVNSSLNLVTLKHYEEARTATKSLPKGPYYGVPFLLKDLSASLSGTVTTGGSRALLGVKAKRDNEIVRRYKQAGFNPFGKTNVPEFGMALTTESTLYGPCRNPWNPNHSTAGSSGGSAAAVAAGVVPVAHGTDGGGSIRVPAAACGVYGLKPTRLLTPRGPGGGLGPAGMSVGHVLTRSVRDSARILDLTAGPESDAPFSAPGIGHGSYFEACQKEPKPLKIALNFDAPGVPLDQDCKKAVLTTARALEQLGHFVEEVDLGLNYDSINTAQSTLVLAQFSEGMHSLARSMGKSVDDLGLERLSLDFVKAGEKFSAREFVASCQQCYNAGHILANLLNQYDLILQPVTATPPPQLGVINYQPNDDHISFVNRFRQYAAYTYLYNLTGQPSASIPAGFTKSGLPLASMLSGRNGDDARVLAVSAQLERHTPWFNQRPS